MYNKYHFESQSIKWSVIVLCVSLLLVYIVLYYAKWDLWKTDLTISQNNTWDIEVFELDYWLELNDGLVNNTWMYLDNTWYNTGDNAWDNNNSFMDILAKTGIELVWDSGNNSSMLVLSWTSTYYWELDFVDILWISYQYALKDTKDIYYLNMWDYEYDFSDIVRKLKWSLYIINTDQELISNSLFGDKVTFINIPEYKNKKVLLLLDINDQSWLLAIDYFIYHQVKPYLKSLFIY
jgi:hypothetical protein